MLLLVCLDIVLTLTQDRCMDVLCDFGHVEPHFNPFGDSGVLAQVTCTNSRFGLFEDSANLDAR
jgi:hypothetical protein